MIFIASSPCEAAGRAGLEASDALGSADDLDRPIAHIGERIEPLLAR